MPATFTDLFTAKVALQLGAVDAATAREGLRAVDAGDGGRLLLYLQRRAGLPSETLAHIDACGRRCMSLKAEDTYMRLLASRGMVPEARVKEVAGQARAARQRLGLALVQAGLLTAEQDRELVASARRALEEESRRILDQMRQRAFAGIETPSRMVAAVIEEVSGGAPVITTSSSQVFQPAAIGLRPGGGPGEGTELLPHEVASGRTPLRGHPVAHAQQRGGAQHQSGVAAAAAQRQGAAQPPHPQRQSGAQHPLDGALGASAEGTQPLKRGFPAELAGTGIEESYDVVRKLGEGGMGAVYLAYKRAKEDDDDVAFDAAGAPKALALKVVRAAVVGSERYQEAAARFKREILATSMCDHENIIGISGAGETRDGSYWMAMEYVEGQQLDEILKREGPLPVPRVVDLIEEVLEGMQAFHRANIVHRDIKPQNFRIWRDAQGRERLKIMDFGIARILDAEDSGAGDQFFVTMGGKITGSPAYIAPESITDPQTVDQRSDLYSLGITVYRIAVNRLPFVAREASEFLPHHLYTPPPSLQEAAPGVPDALEVFYKRLLEKPAANRFASAAEALEFLRTQVRPALEGRPAAPAEPSPPADGAAPPPPLHTAPPPVPDAPPSSDGAAAPDAGPQPDPADAGGGEDPAPALPPRRSKLPLVLGVVVVLLVVLAAGAGLVGHFVLELF